MLCAATCPSWARGRSARTTPSSSPRSFTGTLSATASSRGSPGGPRSTGSEGRLLCRTGSSGTISTSRIGVPSSISRSSPRRSRPCCSLVATSDLPSSRGLDGSQVRRTAADDIVVIVWRRRWTALTAFVAVLASVAAITAALPPVYEATGYMLVTPSRPVSSDFEQTQISSALLTTYEQLLQTQNLADEVERRVGTRPGMPADPRDALTVEGVTDSQLLKVTADAGTPEASQLLANTYTQVFQERTRDLAASGASTGKASVA